MAAARADTLGLLLCPGCRAAVRIARRLSADHFANSVLINKGSLEFELQSLPWQAQLTSFRDAEIVDANKDGRPDILLAGNYYENNIEMGRYDADYGSLLINDGNGGFKYECLKGVVIKGQARKIKKIMVGGKEAYIVVRNNDSAVVVSLESGKPVQ